MPTDCSTGVNQGMADSQLFNQKLLQDDTASDISINRKSLMRHQDGWETLRLRNAEFAASYDHALLASIAIANQTGSTENQQNVSPIRTAAADSTNQQPAGAAYPPIRNVDQGAATANTGILTAMQAIADGIADLKTLVAGLSVTAAGNAAGTTGN